MARKRYLTAKEAARELGISKSTLYSYVSRGLIRSEEGDGNDRARLYRQEDIQTLKDRKEIRRNPVKAAESSLHFGNPVMESGITLIDGGKVYYRGYDVLELAKHASVERVATLVWTGELQANPHLLFEDALARIKPVSQDILKHYLTLTDFEKYQVMLPIAAAQDLLSYDLRPEAVAHTGIRILALLTSITTGKLFTDQPIARQIQQTWAADHAMAKDAINAALVVCADHELNASTFTARCVASTRSTPYHAVMAGMAALKGTKHGGHTERVEAFLREINHPSDVHDAIADRLKRGETLPGFGHPLYPTGDPRGRLLLDIVAESNPNSEVVEIMYTLEEEVKHFMGELPTVDLGLVMLTKAFNFPTGSALTLFALGRTIGWIGHAIEEYQANRMIRPRARYIGERPESS